MTAAVQELETLGYLWLSLSITAIGEVAASIRCMPSGMQKQFVAKRLEG